MKIVIDIDENLYTRLFDNGVDNYDDAVDMAKAIRNGTPLPKGHGKLKDVDELYSIFKENCDAYNIDNLSFISEMDMNFDLAQTIIEADKESEKEWMQDRRRKN